jgi:hypothetical protein
MIFYVSTIEGNIHSKILFSNVNNGYVYLNYISLKLFVYKNIRKSNLSLMLNFYFLLFLHNLLYFTVEKTESH